MVVVTDKLLILKEGYESVNSRCKQNSADLIECQNNIIDINAEIADIKSKLDTYQSSANKQHSSAKSNQHSFGQLENNPKISEDFIKRFEKLEKNISSHTNAIKPSEDYRLHVRIIGLKESVNKNFLERYNNDYKAVKDVLSFLELPDMLISDLRRLGKFSPDRSRPVLVKFSHVWEVRKLISLARNLKNYSLKILIFPELCNQDKQKEKQILKKRYDLIQSGVSKDHVKIRNLKLYLDHNEIITD